MIRTLHVAITIDDSAPRLQILDVTMEGQQVKADIIIAGTRWNLLGSADIPRLYLETLDWAPPQRGQTGGPR